MWTYWDLQIYLNWVDGFLCLLGELHIKNFDNDMGKSYAHELSDKSWRNKTSFSSIFTSVYRVYRNKLNIRKCLKRKLFQFYFKPHIYNQVMLKTRNFKFFLTPHHLKCVKGIDFIWDIHDLPAKLLKKKRFCYLKISPTVL